MLCMPEQKLIRAITAAVDAHAVTIWVSALASCTAGADSFRSGFSVGVTNRQSKAAHIWAFFQPSALQGLQRLIELR